MRVIQQLYSKTGEFRIKTLEVSKIQKMDNALLSFTKYSHVIWVNNKIYPMIFKNAETRDLVYEKLNVMLISKIEEITITLNEFYVNRIPEEQLYVLLQDSYSLNKYLFGVCQQLMVDRNCSFKELHELDAFEKLTINQFKGIQNKIKQSFSDEQIHIFSRSLRYPKKFHDLVSPHTFWHTLSKL